MRELPPTAGLPLTTSDLFRVPRQSFASGMSQWLGIPDPILTCSGTAALVVILETLKSREPLRKRVVLPAYTCPLVVLAVHLAGLQAVVCDLLPGGIDFDPEALMACCDASVLVVVPTHLGGRVADVDTACAIAAENGIFVIEDAAQALGAQDGNGQSAGLRGDAGFFSLAVGKGLTTYEGGVLFSRNTALHAELKDVAYRVLQPGRLWNMRRVFELLGYMVAYNPTLLRYVYGNPLRKALACGDEIEAVGDAFSLADIPLHRLDGFRLRVAANALERLPSFLVSGRERASLRAEMLRSMGVEVLGDSCHERGVWPFLMVRMPTHAQRDTALAALWREGLGVTKLFARTLPDYPYLKGLLEETPCLHAKDLSDRLLTITNSPWLDDGAFGRIAHVLGGC